MERRLNGISLGNQAEGLLTIVGVAAKLGVKVKTVYQWVYGRRIPFVKMGRLLRFDSRDIDKWLEEMKIQPV